MRTRLSQWQVKDSDKGDEMSMKYVSVDHTTAAHLLNDIVVYRIPFPAGIEGVLIHTIRIQSDMKNIFTADLMDGENTSKTIYESLEEDSFHYDQVNVPYKPNDKAFFVRMQNKSGPTTKFKIEIRGIEVK